MATDLIHVRTGRPATIQIAGGTVYISTHDDAFMRMRALLRQRIRLAHPDMGASRTTFNRTWQRYHAWQVREKRWYLRYQVPPPLPIKVTLPEERFAARLKAAGLGTRISSTGKLLGQYLTSEDAVCKACGAGFTRPVRVREWQRVKYCCQRCASVGRASAQMKVTPRQYVALMALGQQLRASMTEAAVAARIKGIAVCLAPGDIVEVETC